MIAAPAPTAAHKPKLVYFQWDHTSYARYASYMLKHTQEHVQCLQQFFDVVVINADCDFGKVCDLHHPDLALFEVGYQSHVSHRIEVRNTSAHPHVPKAALINGDSWSWTRTGAMSDMDRWGIGVGFSVCTTVHDYMPDGLESLYCWPNFIDPAVFRDYGMDKSIPVMLTGMQAPLYPWRQRVHPVLTQAYPCLVSPQHGYLDANAARALQGERYARTLNASLFAPTCGTMAKEVVRKHLEIPGAGACLVTEGTPMVEAAGFVHMENCVFADDGDILDSLDSLMADPARLQRITRAGHDLVHARHTMAQRAQILQWYRLQKSMSPGSRIVQHGPYADLEAVDRIAPRVPHRRAGGLDRGYLAAGYASLLQRDIPTARQQFDACLALTPIIAEARLGRALCDLTTGDPAAAAATTGKLIQETTVQYGARDPDPVAWAVYLAALQRLGRDDEARRIAHSYPRLRHPALDAVWQRLAVASLPPRAAGPGMRHSLSIHDAFLPGPDGWAGLFDTHAAVPLAAAKAAARTAPLSRGAARALDLALSIGPAVVRPNVPPAAEFGYFRSVGLQLRSILRKSPLGAPLADLRRSLRSLRTRPLIPFALRHRS